MIRNFRQFINWHIVVSQETAPDGTVVDVEKKVPFDPSTGRPINPHDPRHWLSHDEAVATGHPVGFVLTQNDPFFFLDLDKCRVGEGWKPEAVAIFQQFAGAAAEVSQSGNGLHIMGTCNQAMTADRRNKWAGWLEFYMKERFVAFGPWGWQGDFSKDCTAQILQIVPQREAVDSAILTTGPSAEYTGPTNDDELISKMMASRGSIAAMFGNKATVESLWKGDAAVLSQAFPPFNNRDAYDRSAADAALMSHLAFWTGRDAPRMDRLFRRSALMREKYETREQYRVDTIRKAIGGCKRVYDVVKPVAEQEAAHVAGEYLTINEMIDWFDGCVYVRAQHRVMIPGGTMLKPEQFKAFYGGKEFQMQADGARPTRDAFEAFTQNRAWSFPKVHDTCFRPKATPGAIIDGMVNNYFPNPCVRQKGNPAPFLDLVGKLLPDPRDRSILLTYCASLVQNPGAKFQWAPVLQGVEGNGKSFVAKCLEYIIGVKYSHSPAAEDLGNAFNAYLEGKLFIAVEEIHMQGRREILDTLKPLITNDRVEIQQKGIDKRMIDNYANWLFNTNHRDAILKSKNDRRYAIFFTAQQTVEDLTRDGMTGDYFPRLWEWARAGGYAIVADYLMTYQVAAEFDPAGSCHRAPVTSTTDQAVEASLGRAEQEVREAIAAEERGFRRGFISSTALDVLFKEKRIRMARQKIKEVMANLEFIEVGRSSRIVVEEDGKRPVIYAHRSIYRRDLSVDEYCLAQGYSGGMAPPMIIPVTRAG